MHKYITKTYLRHNCKNISQTQLLLRAFCCFHFFPSLIFSIFFLGIKWHEHNQQLLSADRYRTLGLNLEQKNYVDPTQRNVMTKPNLLLRGEIRTPNYMQIFTNIANTYLVPCIRIQNLKTLQPPNLHPDFLTLMCTQKSQNHRKITKNTK